MSKHVIDKSGSHDSARMTRYTELEKRERVNGPHSAIEALERRSRSEDSEARAKAFIKIDAEGATN